MGGPFKENFYYFGRLPSRKGLIQHGAKGEGNHSGETGKKLGGRTRVEEGEMG